MRSWLLAAFGMIVAVLIVLALIYSQRLTFPQKGNPTGTSPIQTAAMIQGGSISAQQGNSSASSGSVDLAVDANGLSKATVLLETSQGLVKFKFFSNDAPKTTARIVQLIQQNFYNNLSFHRVVPGFVVQGGDPVGNGSGGSGQKLQAEFNDRHHVEGTVAMARTSDPNSADSQFYISLGTHPHLDHNYTVFGQVIEGMDAVKKIRVGDKIVSMKVL